MDYSPRICHNNMMDATPRSSAYRGGDFTAWQESARKKLTGLLGLPFEIPSDDGFIIEWEKEHEDFHEIRFSFKSEKDVWVCAHLLLPHEIIKPLPLMLCLQGHSTGMHISLGRVKYERDIKSISQGDRDFALQAVKHQYAALALEQRSFGERHGLPVGPACASVAMPALLVGRTLIGERVWDISRTIDIIEKYFTQIDAQRIGAVGNSGGGTAIIYAAALETRIAAAMPSCSLCSYKLSITAMHHCVCNYIPGIANEFDMGDICGLIAPRPLVIVNGREDDIFPIEGAKAEFERLSHLYSIAGSPEACCHVIGDGGHRFYADAAWPVFNELTKL